MTTHEPQDDLTHAPSAEPPTSRWLFYLFFRPTVFFRHFVVDSMPALTALAFYVYGVANALERAESRVMRDDMRGGGSFGLLANSWSNYWTAALVFGTISALALYAIGGWWYRRRLVIAGARNPRTDLACRVYAFSSLVWAIPYLLHTLWATATYDTPQQTFDLDMVGLLVLPFFFWSTFTSYRGVTTAFDVHRGAARTWFLILPSAFFALIMGAFFVAGYSGVLSETPNVGRPREIVTSEFTLSHPGNWYVDPTMEDYDPESYFSIEPPYTDCIVFFHLSLEFDSAEEALSLYRESLETMFSTSAWVAGGAWGPHPAQALHCTGRLEGSNYDLAIYAVTHGGHTLIVQEVCDVAASGKMEAGLDMIRLSFEWKL